MECIWHEELNKDKVQIEIKGDELRHIKALHLKPNSKLQITNGHGLMATGIINRTDKNFCHINITEYHTNTSELSARLALALGLMHRRDRQEFAYEKATELGASDIYPILTEYCQKSKINYERTEAKLIAAVKQCKRSHLPVLHKISGIDDIIQRSTEFDNVILLDEDGTSPAPVKGSCLLLVGPEGGFSPEETERIKSTGARLWSLGNRRLRAETAATLALGLASIYLSQK